VSSIALAPSLLLVPCLLTTAAKGHRGPFHIREKDTEADKKHWAEIVNQENVKRARRTSENQALAHEEGTWQREALVEFNMNIERINVEEGRTGRHKKRKRKAEAMFKEDKLKVTSKGTVN